MDDAVIFGTRIKNSKSNRQVRTLKSSIGALPNKLTLFKQLVL